MSSRVYAWMRNWTSSDDSSPPSRFLRIKSMGRIRDMGESPGARPSVICLQEKRKLTLRNTPPQGVFLPAKHGCAQFAHDIHAGTTADAVGTGTNHGGRIGRGADTTCSLHASTVSNDAPEQGHVFHGGSCWTKSGAGLDEIRVGRKA